MRKARGSRVARRKRDTERAAGGLRMNLNGVRNIARDSGMPKKHVIGSLTTKTRWCLEQAYCAAATESSTERISCSTHLVTWEEDVMTKRSRTRSTPNFSPSSWSKLGDSCGAKSGMWSHSGAKLAHRSRAVTWQTLMTCAQQKPVSMSCTTRRLKIPGLLAQISSAHTRANTHLSKSLTKRRARRATRRLSSRIVPMHVFGTSRCRGLSRHWLASKRYRLLCVACTSTVRSCRSIRSSAIV